MAKALARHIGYIYIDSGAMYRAVTLYCLDHGLIDGDTVDTEALLPLMDEIRIDFRPDAHTGKTHTFLNGVDVEQEIRSMRVSDKVSPVSAIPFVRTAMVAAQQKMGERKGIVMDGRDIGTTVFPHAELKIFVTASAETRAQRRVDELRAKGVEVDFAEVLAVFDDHGLPMSLSHQPVYFGVSCFPINDDLRLFGRVGVIGRFYFSLQLQHDGASGVDDFDVVLGGDAVGLGRLAVGTQQHFHVVQMFELLVVDCDEAFGFEPFHFVAVVDDVAETV